MFMFNSIESTEVAHFQKLTNQSMLNGALVLEMINNFFSESKKNVLIEKLETFQKKKEKMRETFSSEKIKIRAAKNLFSLDFAKYLSYSEVQKNSKIVNV